MTERDAIESAVDARVEATSLDQGLNWMVNAVASTFDVRMAQLRSIVTRFQQESAEPAALARARKRVPRTQRRIVEAAVANFEAELKSIAAEADVLGGDDPSADDVLPQPELAALGAMMLIGEDRLSDLSASLVSAAGEADGVAYANALLNWRQAQQRPPAYLDACLPAAVSEFEELLAALIRVGQLLNPKMSRSPNRAEATEGDESGAGLDEAAFAALDAKSRGFIKKGAFFWRKGLADWPGIDIALLVEDWDGLLEVFHRRNVIVHSGGRVDTQYLERVPSRGDTPLKGQVLTSEPEYVLGALDQIASLGQALAILWPNKLRPEVTSQHDKADALVSSMLDQKRWATAEGLADAFLTSSVGTPAMLQINRWMARRERSGLSEVDRAEVRSWSPPDSGVRWRVARAALLDDAQSVMRELRHSQQQGESIAQYTSWPLLIALRRNEPALGVLLDRARATGAKRPGLRRS